ncbi:MAG: polysaccharide export protein [Muribaculaceae bacterium]|nr:polysaccharide export protein [Muribaculaceae bacterium]
MRIKFLVACAIAAVLALSSCSTPKDITYFPELQPGTIVQADRILDMTVKPEDKLSIVISTQDASLTSLFNLSSGGATSVGGEGTSSGQSLYTVDSKGDINFPVIGRIHVSGLTREQIAETIGKKLISEDLVKDPIVTVEYANAGVSVLGEVASPGRYTFNRDHLTIIDAIAMAGDLTITGKRDDILVMRTVAPGKQEAYRVNLLDAQQLAASPVYYLQQDDVIYVEPNDKKKRDSTATGNSPFTPTFWTAMVSSVLSIATLIVTLTR